MNGPWAKLIPSATLVAVLGYLSLPYFDAPPASTASSTQAPKMTAQSLHPTAPPPTERDPFGGSIRFEMGIARDEASGRLTKSNQAAAAMSGEPARGAQGGANQTPVDKTASETTKAEKTTVIDAAGRPVTQIKTADHTTDVELVLSATWLHGQGRVALINGRAYRPGEQLDASDSQTPCIVAEIHHHQVVLNRNGTSMELRYPDATAVSKLTPSGQAANRSDKAKIAKVPATGRPRSLSPAPRSNSTAQAPQEK